MTTAPSDALTGSDLATWRSYLVATRLLFEELDRHLQSKVGISLSDFGLLAQLSEAGEYGLRMSDLASSTAFSRSRISHAVDRLERLGYVERRACPTDRRGSFAGLTGTGEAKFAEAQPFHADVIRRHLLGSMSGVEEEAFRRRMTEVAVSLGGDPGQDVC